MRSYRLARFARHVVPFRLWRAFGIMPGMVGRRQRPQPAPEIPQSPSLTLLAEIDEAERLIDLRVVIERNPLCRGRLVLELQDEAGHTRPLAERAVAGEMPSRVVNLPSLSFPEGASVDDLARGRWLVRLENGRGRVIARLSSRLVPAGAHNCEAELVCSGDPLDAPSPRSELDELRDFLIAQTRALSR